MPARTSCSPPAWVVVDGVAMASVVDVVVPAVVVPVGPVVAVAVVVVAVAVVVVVVVVGIAHAGRSPV
ncbi:hypothetical protein ACIQMJ_11665 [Actinosynnema sp. NPDC091369]